MKPLCRWAIQARRSQITIVTLVITLAIIHPATAQVESSQPPAELNRLDYFKGNWQCRQLADNTEPAGEFSWNVELGLNGFWYLGNGEQIQPPKDAQPINLREFAGYDVVANKLVRSGVIGNGNSYNLTADDWQNNQLVWTGTIIKQGELTPLRQTIIQDSPDKFTTTYFVTDKEGNWIHLVDETCDRLEG